MLHKVLLSTDVALVCVQHALSTEKQEIMGLLIGEVHENGSVVSISTLLILRRSDKKPDRVEISEEQLVQATLQAERLAAESQRPLHVVGWYHSHPHITVWPSHVDLRTQFMYQRMASTFVGLIFAVFLSDQTTKAHSIQVTCFQSVNEVRRDVRLELAPPANLVTSFNMLTQLPAILKEEEDEAYSRDACGCTDVLDIQHNASVRNIAVGHIVDKASRPMLEALAARKATSAIRLRALKKLHSELLAQLD